MDFTAFHHHYALSGIGITLIGLLVVWELIWKGIALWKAGKNDQPIWFVVLLILNTAGVLEIIYLLFFQKKDRS